ncbi:MAG: TetR family transcriptional regulator [Coriobacteriia bacterium]|nr:TetR family transcriptional regulator [Coriobacteriia bacterium]
MAINVKKLLADALLELSKEKPLAKISITDIVKKAGAGRQTFYNHFQDKDDLLYWIYKQTLVGEQEILKEHGFYAYMCSVYSTAQTKYRDFLRDACALTGQSSLVDAIIYQSYSYYRNNIIRRYGAEVIDERLAFALNYQAYGAGHRYVNWALQGMPGSAEDEVLYMLECMPPVMRKYLPWTEEDVEVLAGNPYLVPNLNPLSPEQLANQAIP